MYHPTKVAHRIKTEIEDVFHFTPEPHTIDQVAVYDQYLKDQGRYVYGDTGQPIGCQNLDEFDRKWMLNERCLVMVDANYGVTRYGFVIDEEGVIKRFAFRVAQQILFGIIADLELNEVAIEIMILKARQLGMCLTPETKVLTADLRWVSIDTIQEGDELVSVDEHPIQVEGKQKADRKMRTAKVQARMEREHETLTLVLDTGVRLTATPEHPFLCRRRGSVSTEWRKTGDMRVGDDIRRLVNTWGESDAEDYWLGGLIDGEGCLRRKDKAGTELSVAQVPGDVLDRARDIMQRKYPHYREEIDKRKGGESSKLGNQPVHKLVLQRAEDLFQILGKSRPVRFRGARWWEGKGLPGKKIGGQWTKIVEIIPAGVQRVINIQTETGTFIAEGVVSHNTTIVELLIMLRIVFSYGVNAVIASADQGKSLMMAKKLLMAYDMLPVWLRPQYTARVESDRGKLEFGALNSGVSIQHGNQMSGIARGATPTVYHLSECASFSNAADQIEAALFKAVHPSPSIFGILESTGEGDVGWWADTWRFSKSNWAQRTARLLPLFLPWFVGLDIYPKPAWLRARPVPHNFYANRLPDTQEHVAKCEVYVRTHDMIRRHLCVDHPTLPDKRQWWVDGTMPLEQQWFWEVGHEEAKAKGLEATWFQEMAGDDIEALQRSSESVFGHDVMERVEKERKKTYDVYGLSGQSIEDNYEPPPEDIDYELPRVPVIFRSPRGPVYNWELIPLHFDHARVEAWKRSNPDAFWDYGQGKLMVWHPPRSGVDYSIGIDTAAGGGHDSTVICVTEIAPRSGMPDIQAAEFRSSYVNHVQAYAFVMAIASWYASAMTSDTLIHHQPLIAPEQVQAVGDVVGTQMLKMGYQRFYRFQRYDNIKSTKSNKLGWFTHPWSRPILIGGFIDTIEQGWYELNSPWTLHECEHFESHATSSGKIKQEHEDGEHDDGIFAAAISIEIVRGKQSKTERSKKRFMGDAEAGRLPALDLSPSAGTLYPTRSLDGYAPLRLEDL
jgi:hypothetical protein